MNKICEVFLTILLILIGAVILYILCQTKEILVLPVASAKSPPVAEVKTVDQIIDILGDCESGGRNIKVLDSNGKYSFGFLQIQSSTWSWWSKLSGITGDPMNRSDSIKMSRWAIKNGFLKHWTCAYAMGLLKK